MEVQRKWNEKELWEKERKKKTKRNRLEAHKNQGKEIREEVSEEEMKGRRRGKWRRMELKRRKKKKTMLGKKRKERMWLAWNNG